MSCLLLCLRDAVLCAVLCCVCLFAGLLFYVLACIAGASLLPGRLAEGPPKLGSAPGSPGPTLAVTSLLRLGWGQRGPSANAGNCSLPSAVPLPLMNHCESLHPLTPSLDALRICDKSAQRGLRACCAQHVLLYFATSEPMTAYCCPRWQTVGCCL